MLHPVTSNLLTQQNHKSGNEFQDQIWMTLTGCRTRSKKRDSVQLTSSYLRVQLLHNLWNKDPVFLWYYTASCPRRMMESSATLLQKPGNSQPGGYLYLQITLFTGIDCFKIILMMGAAIDNILCDHNHSHSIIYVVMNLSVSLNFNTSVDVSCPIIVKCCSKTVCYCGLWRNVFSKTAEGVSFN